MKRAPSPLAAHQVPLFSSDIMSPCGEKIIGPVRAKAKVCQRCKLSQRRSQVVFGVGKTEHPLLALVGEGPGYDEDQQGAPFIGKSGVMLNKLFEKLGLAREDVFITNCVLCRPPGNREPEPDELLACQTWLYQQLRGVQPLTIVTLGATATKVLTSARKSLTELRGKWQQWEGFPVMPTWHPAHILRLSGGAQLDRKREMWADLKQVMGRVRPTDDEQG
jgi:DNA polymerase